MFFLCLSIFSLQKIFSIKQTCQSEFRVSFLWKFGTRKGGCGRQIFFRGLRFVWLLASRILNLFLPLIAIECKPPPPSNLSNFQSNRWHILSEKCPNEGSLRDWLMASYHEPVSGGGQVISLLHCRSKFESRSSLQF